MSLYYAFTAKGKDLYGCKIFSIIWKDWVKLEYSETIKNVPITSSQHTLPKQSSGSVLFKQTGKRILLPENGISGNVGRVCLIIHCLYFFLEIENIHLISSELAPDKKIFLNPIRCVEEEEDNLLERRKM
jgi:hypothetical protein